MELLCCTCIYCPDLFIFIFTKCVLLNLLIYNRLCCIGDRVELNATGTFVEERENCSLSYDVGEVQFPH
jgi:hypothetical protein